MVFVISDPKTQNIHSIICFACVYSWQRASTSMCILCVFFVCIILILQTSLYWCMKCANESAVQGICDIIYICRDTASTIHRLAFGHTHTHKHSNNSLLMNSDIKSTLAALLSLTNGKIVVHTTICLCWFQFKQFMRFIVWLFGRVWEIETATKKKKKTKENPKNQRIQYALIQFSWYVKYPPNYTRWTSLVSMIKHT